MQDITSSRYESYRCDIEAFRDWIGPEATVQSLTAALLEDYLTHLRKQVSKKTIAAKTGAGCRLNTVKQFVRGLWEIELISLPRNIDSHKMKIAVPAPKKKTIPRPDVKKLLNADHGRMRLCLLLMLNCGFGQTDIATLRHDEVDWEAGRIRRKRSKTKKYDRVPEVDYLLWPQTFQLLRQHRGIHDALVLVNKHGRPLRYERIVDGKNKVNDTIKSEYWRLQKRTKTSYPLKLFRKTASSIMAAAWYREPSVVGVGGDGIGELDQKRQIAKFAVSPTGARRKKARESPRALSAMLPIAPRTWPSDPVGAS